MAAALKGRHMNGPSSRTVTVGIGAVAVILVVAGLWFSARSSSKPSEDPRATTSAAVPSGQAPIQDALGDPTVQPVRVDVDLRQHASTRQAISLPRRRLHLALLLPDGSAPDHYEIQVLDQERKPTASASGRASVRDDRVLLQTTLDLRPLPSGTYEFGVRRANEDWRLFHAEVK
jgi:hypothetical protein